MTSYFSYLYSQKYCLGSRSIILMRMRMLSLCSIIKLRAFSILSKSISSSTILMVAVMIPIDVPGYVISVL